MLILCFQLVDYIPLDWQQELEKVLDLTVINTKMSNFVLFDALICYFVAVSEGIRGSNQSMSHDYSLLVWSTTMGMSYDNVLTRVLIST